MRRGALGVRPGDADVRARARRVAELGRVIEREVRARGFSVLREVAGHGVGRTIHEPPDVLNYFNPHVRDRLRGRPGDGGRADHRDDAARVVEDADGWTLRT